MDGSCPRHHLIHWQVVTVIGRVLTFHDLRGTAVTRLALVGATEPEIAAITGLSLQSVLAILDAHYRSRDPALAESRMQTSLSQ
jgi:hypothetical protein